MNELQTLINNVADKKLDKDIDAFVQLLQSNTYNDLLQDLYVQVPDACDRQVRLQYFCSEKAIKKHLIAQAQPRYRATQARIFMQKVESLAKNVEELQGNIDNLLNNS